MHLKSHLGNIFVRPSYNTKNSLLPDRCWSSFSGLPARDPVLEPILDPARDPDLDHPGLVAKRWGIGGIPNAAPLPPLAPSLTGEPAREPWRDRASKLYKDPVFLKLVAVLVSLTLTASSNATFSLLGVLHSLTCRNSGSGDAARDPARDPLLDRRSIVML